MRPNVKLLSSICLGVAMLGVAAVAQETPGIKSERQAEKKQAEKKQAPAAQAKLGEKVPDFTLTDTTGKEHKLSDYAGKIVVLEWINGRCPFVKHCYSTKAMAEAHRAVLAIDPDVVWLAIDSSQFATAEENAAWIEQFDVDYPILINADGSVGHMFGARTTPHMYVADEEQVLRFHGAFDNNPMNKAQDKGEEVVNYVVNAVRQIKEGETVAPDHVQQWGCSVKYARNTTKSGG